jgi:hypothetical protein
MITFIYITCRNEPKLEWFVDSLCNQKDNTPIQLVIVDYALQFDETRKELFSKILVEFALAESAANLNIKGVSVQKIDSVYAFDPLYENKVRKSQYDSTLIYYAHHPKEYKIIYENVLVVLSKLEAKHSLVKTNAIKK